MDILLDHSKIAAERAAIFADAIEHHQAGYIERAETLYRLILSVDPLHASALHFLGMIASQRGSTTGAVALVRRSLALNPATAGFYNNYGEIVAGIDGAVARLSYRHALAIDAAFGPAYGNLISRGSGAEPVMVEARLGRRHGVLEPGSVVAHSNLGLIHTRMGAMEEAERALQRSLAIEPRSAPVLGNLGRVLGFLKKVEASFAAFERALRLESPMAGAQRHRGGMRSHSAR